MTLQDLFLGLLLVLLELFQVHFLDGEVFLRLLLLLTQLLLLLLPLRALGFNLLDRSLQVLHGCIRYGHLLLGLELIALDLLMLAAGTVQIGTFSHQRLTQLLYIFCTRLQLLFQFFECFLLVLNLLIRESDAVL